MALRQLELDDTCWRARTNAIAVYSDENEEEEEEDKKDVENGEWFNFEDSIAKERRKELEELGNESRLYRWSHTPIQTVVQLLKFDHRSIRPEYIPGVQRTP